MKSFKVLALDFDGIVLESNGIKNRAFQSLYRQFPEHEVEILKYHEESNAVPRQAKFQYIINGILRRPQDTQLLERWLKQFQEVTRRELLSCPFVEGAEDFLATYTKKYPTFLVTATPQEEIDWLIEQRKLGSFFKKVYGAPELKENWLKKIASDENISVNELLFVGDSNEDFFSAKKANVPFIGRQGRHSFEKATHPVVRDLRELDKLLSSFSK